MRAAKVQRAVRKAVRTASTAAGINSAKVWDVLTAAAANPPAQSPKQ